MPTQTTDRSRTIHAMQRNAARRAAWTAGVLAAGIVCAAPALAHGLHAAPADGHSHIGAIAALALVPAGLIAMILARSARR